MFKLLIDVAQGSRRKFNLTVSAKTLLYKQKTRLDKISKWKFEIWWAIVRILGPCVAAHIGSLKNVKLAHVYGRIWSCSLVLKFSPTLLVGGELHHYK